MVFITKETGDDAKRQVTAKQLIKNFKLWRRGISA